MVFNSLQFFLFLPAVFLAHHFSPAQFRWLVLLGASFIFYAAVKAPYLILILLLVTVISYGCALRIHRCGEIKPKLRLLWAGIAANVLVLLLLKHFSLLMKVVATASGIAETALAAQTNNTIIIIGTSFFIFQGISYLVDVYLEKIDPEQHFGYFLLYMSFFAKLLQGPIERAGNLLPQLRNNYVFNYENVRTGLLLFAFGLFKKVVVADHLAGFVNAVYGNVHNQTGIPLVIAVYFYAAQIYFDFSGYTDMALGTARMFNIRLTPNFDRPYAARSVADFWRRWHMSFSSWLLDYLFKPLQYSFRSYGNWGTAAALMVTFFVCGFWHGTTATFLVWGLLHGCYMTCSVFYRPLQKKIHHALCLEKTFLLKAWQTIVTFHLIALAWVFFRAETLSDAIYVVTHLHSNVFEQASSIMNNGVLNSKFRLANFNTVRLVTYSYPFILYALLSYCWQRQYFNSRNNLVRWSFYYLLVVAIMLFGTVNNPEYIYANF